MSPEDTKTLFAILETINNNLVAMHKSSMAASGLSLPEFKEAIRASRPHVKPEAIIRGILAKVQKDFEDRLTEKTGWGRREVSQVLSQVLADTDKWGIESFR